ncbi:MAG: SDR family NAD(P)-dependent oxidoreductase [Mycobacteriales bacterium]
MRTAVVTGGASGIGKAIAFALAADGHRIGVLDRQGDAAQAVAMELVAQGGEAVGLEVDVADWKGTQAAIGEVRRQLGDITVMVTSAGISAYADITAVTEEEWNRVLGINLTGTFAAIQAVVPDMLAATWGRIVTISSASAQIGAPRMAHYTASKGGVIGLTKSLARDLAPHGITVNTIPPSIVHTPMMDEAIERGDSPGVDIMAMVAPVGRVGTAEDIAAATVFLCSDSAGFITGQQFGVNGGLYV